jgi:hypothetical protein
MLACPLGQVNLTTEQVTYALLTFATLGMGFAGRPSVAFVAAAGFIAVLSVVDVLEVVQRYRGEPKTDLVLAMIFKAVIATFSALALALAGYGLRLTLLTGG